MKAGAEMDAPPLFRCPISLDLLQDPVTLCTGQTYDRHCIEKWLADGHFTCPVTMQKLDDISMVPNHTLSHLIAQWLIQSSSSRSDQDCLDHHDDDTDIAFGSMKRVIESDESTLQDKLRVVEKALDVLQEQPLIKNSSMIRSDLFGSLFQLVLKNARNLRFQESLIFLEKALACVVKLMASSEMGALNIMKSESNFEDFLILWAKGSVSIKKSLCVVVEAISSSAETRELAEMIGNSVGISREIIRLIEKESNAAEAGIAAISALSSVKQNRENLAKQGAVQELISYFSGVEKLERNVVMKTMAAIENLLSVETAKVALINHPLGVSSLVKIVFRVSNHEGSESAVNLLSIICGESEIGREKAIEEGLLTQLLLLLQSQCSGRIKAKARKLLNSL